MQNTEWCQVSPGLTKFVPEQRKDISVSRKKAG